MLPSLANSSGSALAQKPLWETRSGQAYLGSESGWMREGSLLVKPRRSAPLQQHCFLVIWTAGGWPQTARSPAQPLAHFREPTRKGLAPLCRPPPWRVALPSLSTIWAPFPPQELVAPMATPCSPSFFAMWGRLRKEYKGVQTWKQE